MRDGIGINGAIFNYALLIVLFGSTLLIFIYLWRKGLVDMSETPKYKMMDADEEENEVNDEHR
jgi:hypothetical protein